MSFQRKLTNLTNVSAGATATLRIPVGPTYDGILLRLIGNAGANATLANVQSVRLMANAKVVREYDSLAVLNTINQIYGRGAAANAGAAGAVGTDTSVMLHFTRPEIEQFFQSAQLPTLHGINAARTTAFRTGNLNTLTLEFTIAAAYASPSIEAYSVEQPDSQEPIGLIEKVRRFTYTPSGAGTFETLFDIPRGPRIMAIHYSYTAGIIQNMTLKANSIALFDVVSSNAGPLGVGGAANSAGALEDIQRFTSNKPMTAQTGFDTICFVQNGSLDEALRTANLRDLRNTVQLSAGGAMTVLVEYLDTFEGL